MAETYRTGGAAMSGSSRQDTGAGSPSYGAQRTSRADDPLYDVGSAYDSWSDYDEDYDGRSGSRVDDLIPVLGIVLGGAVGYMLGTMIGDQSRSGQGSGRGMLSGRGREAGKVGKSRPSSTSSVEKDESTDLIASSKVEGTAVYNREGERLGEVYNFMVGKRSGRVAYAVMSFGGFLGIGQRYHALPWNVLTYDTDRGGYVIDADRDLLMKAPSYGHGEEPFSRSDRMRSIRDYWSSGHLSL
jgi:hypothetical protein